MSTNACDDPSRADESEGSDESARTHNCNVKRREKKDSATPKRRSMGFLASFFSCGIYRVDCF